jgi:pimeloyl-ACP methyl ester carboxylesterase
MTRTKLLAVTAMILAGTAGLGGCSRQVTMEGEVIRDDTVTGPAGTLHINDGGAEDAERGAWPVVFVHSYAGSAKHWEAQLAHLRPTRRAVAIDLRGHGESEPPENGDYSIASLAEDIAAVEDDLDLGRFVLVGHSMGGAAALDYARTHSDDVAGLVLVGTPGKSSPELATQVMSALESDYDKTMEDFWERLLRDARPEVAAQIRSEGKSVPREASLKIIRAIFDYDPMPSLTTYRGPTLFIDAEGEDSPGALYTLEPSTPRKVIPGVSHWVQLDKPEEFNRILDGFLASLQ